MRQLISSSAQVGEIFRGRRKALRLNQEALASKVGVSQSRLSTLEADAAGLTLDRLLQVAKLLGFELVLQDTSETSRPKAAW